MRRAWAFERSWSKAEILEAYLNLVPFRGELEGITAASYLLFDKAPHGLTKGEATVLAVMLRAPNASPQLLLRRAERLYDARSDTMSRDEISKSVALVMHAPVSFSDRTSLAPHLARRLLSEQGRHTPVQSTLESRIQRFALETLRRQLLAVHEQGVEDGAVLVVDNATGDVLAYVGGSGELSSASYVDGAQARRQAGSTLKPFLYGLALENRLLTPASLLEDAPLDVAVAGGVYRPRNYDEQFKGLISMRTALASSLNVPAVRTLALVGEDVFTQKLRALGLQGVAESGEFYGPSLALGSVDVTLWELVNAYRTLANGGEWSPLRMTVEEVTSRKSQVESQKFTSARRVYSAETAFLVSSILSDRESRSATFGLENVLATPFWSAVKTGTSKDMRDNWCVGYSSRYTAGVWVGNFSGAPMKNVSGVTGAAPIWAEMMTWLQHVTPSQPPRPPSGVVAHRVVFPQRIEAEREEWFFQGTEPRDVTPDLAREQARIVAPVDGVLIALDPDIPPARQRIVFGAASSQATLYWRLDGTRVGTAAWPFLWEPRPGRHTLTLCDEHDAPVDTIRFSVRGLAEHVAGRN
jgi:penicillin-binding protein 1C